MIIQTVINSMRSALSQRHLAALLCKRLGSSSFAVASTLRKIIARMEDEYANGKVRDNRGGLVEFDDLTDEERSTTKPAVK